MRKIRPVITSDAVPQLLKEGGRIEYRPVTTGKGWHWELWAIPPAGSAQHVISSKTGEPRVFKSADALLAFHIRNFPGEQGLLIPVPDATGKMTSHR